MLNKRGLIILGLVFSILSISRLLIPALIGSPVIDKTAGVVSDAFKQTGIVAEPQDESDAPERSLRTCCDKLDIAYPPKDISIVIDKSEYCLYLYSGDKQAKAYRVSFGPDPVSDKEREGDGRTPEGEFYVCQKAKHPEKAYLGSRWLRLSYPNKEDAERGLEARLIDRLSARSIKEAIDTRKIPPQTTPLGGGIGIHGGGFDRGGDMVVDWTAGCIALYDYDIEEFYDFVDIGTRVVVRR